MTANGYVVRIADGQSCGGSASVEVPIVIGREGDLAVDDRTVSRRHALVEPGLDSIRIRDLGSTAGVVVNGTATRSTDLAAGDSILLGQTTLRVLRLVRYSDAAAGPAIRIRHRGKDRVVALHDGATIGRDADCNIRIDDDTVSRRHAVVRIAGGRVRLEDLHSANGTRVGERPLRDSITLADGVTIGLGMSSAQLTFSEGAAGEPITIRLSAEGSGLAETLQVDAAADATVAEVTRDLACFVDVPDQELLLYRLEDGALLHPDDRWSATGVRQGDHYVIGVGDASSVTAAPGRHWPHRSTTTLNQLPRTVWPEPAYVVERIDPPESASLKGRGVQWQVAGGIGATILGLTLVLTNPSYAVFGIITGGIGVISIAASILGEQSRRKSRIKEYRGRLAALDAALGQARIRQAASLHDLSPSVETLEAWLSTSSSRIWERRPTDEDALRPTIGIGRRSTRIAVERTTRTDSPHAAELSEVIARHAHLDRVPVGGPGPQDGSLGVCGPSDTVNSLLARIIIEAAMLHPPNQLAIWVAASAPGWEWCRWLPHVTGGGVSQDPSQASALVAMVSREQGGRDASGAGMLHLVVVPNASRQSADAFRGSAHGSQLLVVGSSDQRVLPSGLTAVLQIDSHGRGSVIGSYRDAPEGDIDVCGISDEQAERLAVSLGRLGGRGGRSGPSGLVELLGLGTATQPDVIGAWKQPPSQALTVAVGSDDSGAPVTVGFRRDGPHGMIAGTTGSGKSELMQTILTALALTHSPERLNLFLVDFKGGSTFAPLATLPHVAGLVTDLESDSSLALRALTALDAEIDRRKRVLESARVPDVIAYARAGTDGREPLPDLLVVIDEFALLMERQPEVRDRLDTIATQGRSLGIHMLLATQSPSGVITHAIRTNTNLWICLRVVVESESMEILGTRDAAHIPDASPGRAIIRLGAGHDLRTFQAARIARPVPDQDSRVRITPLGGAMRSIRLPSALATELDVVVGHIRAAADQLGLSAVTPLWLPPLPKDLPADAIISDPRRTDRLTAVIGLADHPRRHAQVPFEFDLSASGHALVSGVFGFGKTTALWQVAADLANHYSPEDVHIYAIDAGAGSLGPLVDLPHVGDVVGANEVERLTRLIDRLTRAIDSRREELAIAGAGDFLRWRANGGTAPWTVLLVDDYSAFREVAEQVETGRLLERFNSLLQNGPAVGIHIVVSTAQTNDLRAREHNLILARLILRAADSSEYGLVDVRLAPNEMPNLPPGRGLTAGGVEVQVVRPDLAAFIDVVDRWAAVPPARLARPVPRLPLEVRREQIAPRRGELVIGLGGPDIEPVSIPFEGGSAVMLIAGASQSGRSSTLVSLLASIGRDPSQVLVIAPRPNALREFACSKGFTLHSSTMGVDDALDAFAVSTEPGRVLVIDDAEMISSLSGVSARLEQVVRNATETGTTVLVAARVNDLSGMFDPWARYVMSLRRVVLLWPTVDDAFMFGVKLPAIPPPLVPGRGLLVDRNRAMVVQVALLSDTLAGSERNS